MLDADQLILLQVYKAAIALDKQCPGCFFHMLIPTPLPSLQCTPASADVEFLDAQSLEEDRGFPDALFAFLRYLHAHSPAKLKYALVMPAQKEQRTPRRAVVV